MQEVDPAYDTELEWLHCNRCKTSNHVLHNPKSPLSFFITSCAHTCCEVCMKKYNPSMTDSLNGEYKCPRCELVGPIILVGSDMPQDVESLLIPTLNHMEDLVQIFKYQYGNAVVLLKHLKKTCVYNRRRCTDLEEQLRSSQVEITRLKSELEFVKRSGGNGQQTRPLDSSRPSSSRSNTSLHTPSRPSTSVPRLSLHSPFKDQRLNTPTPFVPNSIHHQSTLHRPSTSYPSSSVSHPGIMSPTRPSTANQHQKRSKKFDKPAPSRPFTPMYDLPYYSSSNSLNSNKYQKKM